MSAARVHLLSGAFPHLTVCGKNAAQVQLAHVFELGLHERRCRSCWRMRDSAAPGTRHYTDPPPGAVEWSWLVMEAAMRHAAEELELDLQRYGLASCQRREQHTGWETRQQRLFHEFAAFLSAEQRRTLLDWALKPPAVLQLADQASPVQCNGDAEPRRSTGGESAGAGDPAS